MLLKKILFICLVLANTTSFAQAVNEQQQINQLLADAKKNIARDTLKSRQALQQALQIATKHKFAKSIGTIYALNGELEGRASRHNNALMYFNKALAIYQKANDTLSIADTYNNLGNTYGYLNNTKQAEASLLQAIKLYRQLNNEALVGKALMNLGIKYFMQNDFKTGADYAFQSLKIREKLGNEEDLSYSYSAIGTMYLYTNKFEESLTYNKKSLQLSEKLGNLYAIGVDKTNIAKALYAQGNNAEAKKYLLQAIVPSEKVGNKRNLRHIYEDLSDIAQKENNIDEAATWLSKAIDIYKNTQGAFTELALYANRHKLHVLQKKYKEAEEDLLMGEKIIQKQKMSTEMVGLKRTAAIFYATIGKADEAKKAFAEFEKYKDSALNATNLKQINELKTQYETEKKQSQIDFLTSQNTIQSLNLKNKVLALNTSKLQNEHNQLEIQNKDLELGKKNYTIKQKELQAKNDAQQIGLLNKQTTIQQLKIDKRNQTIVLLAGFSLLVFIIGYQYFNRRKLQQQAYMQQQLALQQETLTKAVIDAEEKERQRIGSDLHDGVGQLLSAVKMNLSGLTAHIEPNSEQQRFLAEKTLALIDESCKEVRAISHQMMPDKLLQSGLVADVQSFIEKLDSERLKVSFEANGFKNRLESNVEIILYRAIQETINNVLKHAKASHLNIKLERSPDDTITAQIKDNGVGFDTRKINQFEGIGIKNILARIEYLRGTVNYLSSPQKGTTVLIKVPI